MDLPGWKGIIVPCFLLVVVSGLLWSFQLTEAEPQTQATRTYINEEYGLQLSIPSTWVNSYEVERVAQNADGYKALVFTEKRYHYPLLQIALIPESKWGSYEKTIYVPIGKRDGFIYGSFISPETLFINDEKGNKKEISYITQMLGDIQDLINNKQYTILK